ncbi:WhiB family transcriptional regulator [Pseudonocardia sp. ICBG1142]|uniref:WhiB family transcriptional regulator n=1 Tax=Pseudonocardia sp. ICBG1142 TaxID=2846760 RepID=UPI001CF66E3D|nr:WhiB family transcriptional regulator [Pseudonocardia sp. ICBG1142]
MSTNARTIRVKAAERGLTAELTALILDADRGSAEHDWRHQSACAARMDDLMFPAGELGSDVRLRETAGAKQVCANCPVQAQCREWGIENEAWGVWGGLDEDERAILRRRQGRPSLPDLLAAEQDWDAA